MQRRKMSRTLSQSPAMLVLIAVLIFATSMVATGQSETILHDFINLPHGATPQASLIADAAGNLYGTTAYGGTYSRGTVFRLTPGSNGRYTETVLYSFIGAADGAFPAAGLIFDAAGNLYGTTSQGGTNGIGRCFNGCGTVFRLSPGANGSWTSSVIYVFAGYPDGGSPVASLVFDGAGNLYGTTEYGGTADDGTVFELTPSLQGTWTETILHNFADSVDGAYPLANLITDQSGNLYGTASQGGDQNCNNYGYSPVGCGTVFKLTHNQNGTWTETVLHAFTPSEGNTPLGNVIFDSAGNLYGTTEYGINSGFGYGTVFKMVPASDGSWTLSTVYVFPGGTDGTYPFAGLVLGANGHFYGTTKSGPNCQYGCGTVFELTPTSGAAWRERIIHNFSGSPSSPNGIDGSQPIAGLIFDQAGNLYGTASAGGLCNRFNNYTNPECGTVFKLSRTSTGGWSTSSVYQFTVSGDALNPSTGFIADALGNLYGTAPDGGAYGNGAVFELIRQHGGGFLERVLYSFAGGVDGSQPYSGLIFDSAGNLYGTTLYGGDLQCPPYANGCGTIFELSPAANGKWTKSILHAFTGGSDGAGPYAGLTSDSAGNLYGDAAGSTSLACGTAFKLSPSLGAWTFSVFYTFNCLSDGGPSVTPLIFDKSGNLYGASAVGGAKVVGAIFQLSPNTTGGWTGTVIHSFHGNDGIYPGSLILGSNGKIYGSTPYGGGTSCYGGCGLIFSLFQNSTGQWNEHVLYNFTGGSDGSYPRSGVILDPAGNLYGTTWGGGLCNPYCDGTLFKLTLAAGTWSESTVYTFGTNPFDAAQVGALLLDSLGNFYGAGSYGGFDGNGAAFEISPTQSAQSTLRPAGQSPRPNTPMPRTIRHAPLDPAVAATSTQGGK